MKPNTPEPASTPQKKKRETVTRISVSLPPSVAKELDTLVTARGFDSRSQAITSIINESLIDYRRDAKQGIMAGSITLFFDQTRKHILEDLAGLKRSYLDEVIGSLQVQLENNHIMEVVVVQGPVETLQEITDELLACKGIVAGKLTLTSSIIPPVHPLPAPKSE